MPNALNNIVSQQFDIRKALTREQQEQLAMRMRGGGGPMRGFYPARGRGRGGCLCYFQVIFQICCMTFVVCYGYVEGIMK